jgi:hypothetical protein
MLKLFIHISEGKFNFSVFAVQEFHSLSHSGKTSSLVILFCQYVEKKVGFDLEDSVRYSFPQLRPRVIHEKSVASVLQRSIA